MGALQTYFYLALIAFIMVGLTLYFIGVAVVGLVRFARSGQSRLTAALVGGAVLFNLVFIVVGTIAVGYAFLRYGPT
jgi:hypothetical protein